MQDIVARVPTLSFIDIADVLVFARFGRSHAEGAFATCHCLSLPPSEPGYYFWRDRASGRITRRSEWFVTKSPVVTIGTRQIEVPDLVRAAALLRSVARALAQGAFYPNAEPWIAKLDTVVHELYHIDPERHGHPADRARRRHLLGQLPRHTVLRAGVAAWSRRISTRGRIRRSTIFCATISRRSKRRHGGVVGTTLPDVPVVSAALHRAARRAAAVRIGRPRTSRSSRCAAVRQPTHYTEDDLHIRQFSAARRRGAWSARDSSGQRRFGTA